MNTSKKPDWNLMLEQALCQPGSLSKAYSVFHEYSLGNGLLAVGQLIARGLPISPIASYKKWLELGRQVKKGEKAIALVMPVIVKSKSKNDEDKDEEGEGKEKMIFVLKNNWFALSQTEGPDFSPAIVNNQWDKARALETLGISECPYDSVDGNAQGYAIPREKKLAINPLAELPWKTTFHEMAHCLLHSAEAQMADGEMVQRSIMEAEAEAVAYLCCATLELPGLEESRAYIQDWLGSEEQSKEFKKKSAARVFAAASKILKAGNAKIGEDHE